MGLLYLYNACFALPLTFHSIVAAVDNGKTCYMRINKNELYRSSIRCSQALGFD
jgi:hypothetical protein